ncbi:MAG: hypothetical protein LLG04_17295 [Parachlamydia sp.]|nr:hypothetical protein [Parachlamydia sp.]
MKASTYKDPPEISRDEANTIFTSGSNEEIRHALLSVALYDGGWEWSQDQCLRFLNHPDPGVRRMAALGLGHVARIHLQLQQELVITALNLLIQEEKNEKVVATAEETLENIEFFLNGNDAESNEMNANTDRRIGVDCENNEIVILDYSDETPEEKFFHGHVREWSELRKNMQNLLIEAGKVDQNGEIL